MNNTYENVASRMRIAIRIDEWIKQTGLSTNEFAQLMGKKPNEIHGWLSGTHDFTNDELNKISKIIESHYEQN